MWWFSAAPPISFIKILASLIPNSIDRPTVRAIIPIRIVILPVKDQAPLINFSITSSFNIRTAKDPQQVQHKLSNKIPLTHLAECFTFNFVDPDDQDHVHDGHMFEKNTEHITHYHAYKINFTEFNKILPNYFKKI